MKNITKLFEKYREAARHLRNIYYIPDDENDWDTIEDFDEISILLFKHFVVDELKIPRQECDWLSKPSNHFLVKSSSADLPIMINRDGQSGYWDNPITLVKENDLEMYFINYFDWDSMGQIDFRYIRVRIISSEKYPTLVGNDALIETTYTTLYYEE